MFIATASQATTVFDTDFSDDAEFASEFTTSVHAARAVDGQGRDVVRLTNNATFRRGGLFTTNTTSLDQNASFSTRFLLNMNARNGTNTENGGGDGIVFVVAASNNAVGGAGNAIGYGGIGNSVGIEFDTINNGAAFGDQSINHVAVNTNGTVNSPIAYRDVPLDFLTFDAGEDIWAWVDYDGTSDLLSLRLSTVEVRPTDAYLSVIVDLVDILGQTDAFFGFTAGTGFAYNNHDVVNWRLEDDFTPIGQPVDPVDPAPADIPAPAALGLLGLGLAGLGFARGRKN